MTRLSTCASVVCTTVLIGFLAVMPSAGSAWAQSLNEVVRNLNSVLNPNDARRLEEQAYRNGRSDEQRYWHNYRVGLESSDRHSRDYGPDRGDQARYGERGDNRNWDEYGDRGYGSSRPDSPGDRYYRYDQRQ
ncbi:MAG: hypothetical protein JO081_21090 [Alphaproteobacteria bacterium]|nr:hypothetical protein [Alphaproteobacteria bacterium]